MMRAWDDYLTALSKELGIQTVNKWLRSLKILNFDAANIYLEAADTFHANWLEEHILPKAAKDFRNENNRPVKIHLQVPHKLNLAKEKHKEAQTSPYQIFIKDPLDSEFTFDNLVELSQNKIIYKLFFDFKDYNSEEPLAYNPIYIYGSEGIGKTHLLQALAQSLQTQGIHVIYTKSTTFTQNMVTAIKAGKMADFRKFYRECDFLIIDEVHNLSNKSTTQEELFHTFNALHIENKQIILSSHLSPGELKNIEPRLISRFEWGLVMPLHGPNPSQLKKILNKKCEEVNFSLSSEAKDFLIKKFSKSPKVLSRALSALILRAHLKMPQEQHLNSLPLSPETIGNLLSDLIQQEVKSKVTVEQIIDQIASYFGVEATDILGKSQSREFVLPRQVAMFICREHLKLPYMKIGQIFSRDHSTVMSSVKQIQKNILQKDSDFSKIVFSLRKNLFPTPS